MLSQAVIAGGGVPYLTRQLHGFQTAHHFGVRGCPGEMLIRMAVRPFHTVPPHQQVPSACMAVHSRLLTGLLVSAALLLACALEAEQIPVRHKEGTVHGFLVLRTQEGKQLAAGDLIQVVRGDRLISELVFHFKDGSVDDEVTVFSQRGNFRLLSDHHVQKGPSFPHPMDVSIDASTGDVQVRSTEDGKEKVETEHLDLPPDLANGMILTILKNISPDTPETKLSYVVTTPKPRLVKLAITPQGEDTLTTAGSPHRATQYVLKVELGGIAGVVAPLIGKQPQDLRVWVLGGKAPAFVRMEGPLFESGPIWRIELTSPVWQKSRHSQD
ncbi:MAG: hypothetical protein JWN45_3502 [Acidobacteriaceae bacterium]|nr:hypothetical protein [Acidobacteriaceae bacterium]